MNSTIAAGDGDVSGGAAEFIQIRLNHRHDPKENQCSSVLVKYIKAPVHLVSLCFFVPVYRSPLCVYRCFDLIINRFGLW